MDADANIVKEVKKWTQSLKAALPELQLERQFRTQLSSMIASLPPSLSQTVELKAWPKVLAHNSLLIKAEIEAKCREEEKCFTSKAALRQVRKVYPSGCFSNIRLFSTIIEARVLEVLRKYCPPTSPTRSRLTVSSILPTFETSLISAYREASVEDFSVLDAAFESLVTLPSTDIIEQLPVHQLDTIISNDFQQNSHIMLQSLSDLTDNQLPSTLSTHYLTLLKDKFVSFARSTLEVALKRTQATIADELKALAEDRDDMRLFDERVTDSAVKRMVATALRITVSQAEFESETESITMLWGLLTETGPDITSNEEFYEKLHEFKQCLTDQQRTFIAVSILLVLTRTCFQIVPSLRQPTTPQYTPSARELFRRLLSTLFACEHSVSVYITNEWYLGYCAEKVLAGWLTPTHPLVAHLPDKMLEDMCQCGGQQAYEEGSTPEEPRTNLRSLVKSAALEIINGVTSLGESGKPTRLPFVWKRLKDGPGISATVVVSGWYSEQSDFGKDWKGVLQHEMQGVVLGLGWDADTQYSFAWKTFLRTIPSMPLGYFSTALGAVSGSVQLFKEACKRAKRAGKLLAQSIALDACGQGPVSLIGFSLGAAVVYECLKELGRKYAGREVMDVILLGGAVGNEAERWERVRPLIRGRLINVFSSNDGVLRSLYKIATDSQAAGLKGIDSIIAENFDASSYIEGHQDHRKKMAETMELIGYKP